MRCWKANKTTADKIRALLQEWADVRKRASRLARKCGASSRTIYTNSCMGRLYVTGFIFKDEANVDKKQFVRLKNTRDGWRPRRNRTELSKEFEQLNSDCIMCVMELIGMKSMKPGEDGFHWHSPGIKVANDNVYVTTPDYVEAKGCKRISDLQFEKETKTRAEAS